MLQIYYKNKNDEKMRRINQIRDGVLINVEHATTDDLAEIVALTGINYSDVEEALDPHELPRIERLGKATIIFIRYPKRVKMDKEHFFTEPVTIIITDKFFITISINENEMLADVLDDRNNILTTQRTRLLFYVLLKTSRWYTHEIKDLRKIFKIEKESIKEVNNNDIINLIVNEEILNQYIYSLVPMQSLLQTISTGKYLSLYEDDNDLVEDLLINLQQSVDLCRVSIKTIQSLRESFQISFTNRLNKTIQFLTAFTIILTIPTIIASIYGMNVQLPFDQSSWAFLYVMGFTGLIVWVVAIIFQKMKWFK